MALYQAGKFSAVPGCVIGACIDHNRDHGEAFARRLGIPRSYTSMDAMLESGECDALSCAVVDSHHFGFCMAALQKAMPVFCEKPLARTLAECEALRAAAEQYGVPNRVNFSKRNAALGALKDTLGALGILLKVRAEYLQSWVTTKVWGDWRTMPRWKWRLQSDFCTAGAAGDLGSHLADALLYLFGGAGPADLVRGLTLGEAMEAGRVPRERLGPEFSGGGVWVELESRLTLSVPSGEVPAEIKVSWISPGALDAFRIILYGTKARAVLDLEKSRAGIFLYNPDSTDGPDSSAGDDPVFLAGSPAVSSYESFIRAAEGYTAGVPAAGPPDHADFEQGFRVQQILDRLVPGGLPR
jgi:predicted dehydrogenase